jgi:FdhD protein
VGSVTDIDSVTVDWDVAAAAVKTRRGIEHFEQKTSRRIVTTGCGQGTVFGDLMTQLHALQVPPADHASARLSQGALYRLLEAMRRQESTYKSSGSVHGCALFRQEELLMFVEIFYTTGRLTSEMVMKSAQLGVPIVVSRSGITQMGYQLATELGLALFGRATHRHFICYCGFERFEAQPEPAPDPALVRGERGQGR